MHQGVCVTRRGLHICTLGWLNHITHVHSTGCSRYRETTTGVCSANAGAALLFCRRASGPHCSLPMSELFAASNILISQCNTGWQAKNRRLCNLNSYNKTS